MSEQLTPKQLRRRFDRTIVPVYLEPQREAPPGRRPRFVSVGGQPGAGKGGVLAATQSALPGAVVVNGDDLRRFHPAYEQTMSDDPFRMPEVTAAAAGAWVGMSTEYLRGVGASAIVETTLRNESMLRGEFEAFRAAGFETELRVVAVPLAVSRAGTVARYVEQVKDYGTGRWTPGAAHDEAAANVSGTVRELVAAGVVDRVVVQDRAGRVFLDARAAAGGAELGERVAAAVDQARDVRSLTTAQARDWIGYTGEALRETARLRRSDPDLVRVARRLALEDAGDVVRVAFPGDARAQRAALTELHAAAKALDAGADDGGTSSTSADRLDGFEAVRRAQTGLAAPGIRPPLSSPETTRDAPPAGGPSSRRNRPHLPGARYGNDQGMGR
ncbi:zeta toxin family protein [Microbacterium sp. HMWF026]|uniref:zeta toxin family protein n=1 Tax=Microbacterium sp. HMWF026 TaxID=2056861 RepID=UPI0015E82108|nr:zeta toxin family protein [Microbacterium sp. HMWF026]